jgi:hypothetical protein
MILVAAEEALRREGQRSAKPRPPEPTPTPVITVNPQPHSEAPAVSMTQIHRQPVQVVTILPEHLRKEKSPQQESAVPEVLITVLPPEQTLSEPKPEPDVTLELGITCSNA